MAPAGFLRMGAVSVLAAAAVFLFAPQSFAETDDEGWKLSMGPNLWLAGADGDARIRGQEFDIDVSFDDILENADAALMLRIEAQKGRFGLFLQPNYLNVNKEDEKLANVDAEINVDFWMVEFGGFYQFGRWVGKSAETPTTMDLLIGGRYWALNTELNVSVPVLGIAEDRETERDLIDPTVGLRVATFLTEKLKLTVWGDVGGFDVSDDSSKFTWQAAGQLGYKISKKFTISAGYRAIRIEAENEADELNLTFHGPLIGLTAQY